jgi:drug/metabolite transporter (DMT)-like permease
MKHGWFGKVNQFIGVTNGHACQAISLWYSALALLPLTDVVVLGFLTPLFVALGSFLVLKEHCSRCRSLFQTVHHADFSV